MHLALSGKDNPLLVMAAGGPELRHCSLVARYDFGVCAVTRCTLWAHSASRGYFFPEVIVVSCKARNYIIKKRGLELHETINVACGADGLYVTVSEPPLPYARVYEYVETGYDLDYDLSFFAFVRMVEYD